jgi:pyruvate/2-oxoglutarate dehydrogenase complex dihydrolipoamide dehydrogenase (E3) component
VANIEKLGLEKTKVKTDKGRVIANGYLENA